MGAMCEPKCKRCLGTGLEPGSDSLLNIAESALNDAERLHAVLERQCDPDLEECASTIRRLKEEIGKERSRRAPS